MTEFEKLLSQNSDLHLEVLRSREGARAATKGIKRLHGRIAHLERLLAEETDKTDRERAGRIRAERAAADLQKRVERLSLRLIGEWGKEARENGNADCNSEGCQGNCQSPGVPEGLE